MDLLLKLVLVLSVVAVVSGAARRFNLLSPVLLVVVGIGLSFVPGFPNFELSPDFVLVGVLPPLLYVAALQTSVPDFRFNLRPILLLAVGLVLFTTAGVGFGLHWSRPEIPLAACIAFGAVIAPTDAVSATAIARRIGLPRRLVTILEGESLVNDATALTLLTVAVAAVDGGSVTWAGSVGNFLWHTAGGIAVGIVVSTAIIWIQRRVTDALLDNAVAILTPFLAYVAADQIHASGVVAVVLCGLRIGARMPEISSAASRLQNDAFWRVTEFLLQGTLFLLLGLQMRGIVTALDYSAGVLAGTSVLVLLLVVVLRFLWMYPATYLPRALPGLRGRDPSPRPAVPALLAWAGMRGAVSMAAAFSLPTNFPERDLMLWLTFVVILGTLVGQGLTLPAALRLLRLPPDDLQADVLAEAQVQQAAFRAASQKLEHHRGELTPEVYDSLQRSIEQRANSVWERLGSQEQLTPSAAYRKARRYMLSAERESFRKAREQGQISEEVLVRVQRDLDLEESLLSE